MPPNSRRTESKELGSAKTPAPKGQTPAPEGPGSPAATAEDLARYIADSYKDLYLQALGIVRSPEVAEDIVQQAFVDTMAAIKKGTEIQNLGGWLRSCTYYLCVKRCRRQSTLELMEDSPSSVPQVASVDEEANLRRNWEKVHKAVDQLPESQKSVFLLAEVHGFAYRDIAEALDKSENSVRMLLNRARNFIREDVNLDRVPAFAPLLKDRYVEIGIGRGPSVGERLSAKVSHVQALWGSVTNSAEVLAGISGSSAVALGCAALITVCTGGLPQPSVPDRVEPVTTLRPPHREPVSTQVESNPNSQGGHDQQLDGPTAGAPVRSSPKITGSPGRPSVPQVQDRDERVEPQGTLIVGSRSAGLVDTSGTSSLAATGPTSVGSAPVPIDPPPTDDVQMVMVEGDPPDPCVLPAYYDPERKAMCEERELQDPPVEESKPGGK